MHVLIVLVGSALYYSAVYYFAAHFGQSYPFVTTVLGFALIPYLVLVANDFSPSVSVIYALIASTVFVSISILIFS